MLTAHKLIAAVIVTGLLALVLACGPTAPGQPDHTPAPAAEKPPGQSVPTATPQPTPVPTSGPYDRSDKLDGMLKGAVVQYRRAQAAAQGDTGRAGPAGPGDPERPATPPTVDVYISAKSVEQHRVVKSFLIDHGITPVKTVSYTPLQADVPVAFLTELVDHPGVAYIQAATHPYPNMDTSLNNTAAEYEAGLMTAEEGKQALSVYVESEERATFAETRQSFINLRDFLKSNGAFFTTAPEETVRWLNRDNEPARGYGVYVPISLLPSLGKHPDLWRVSDEGGPYPREMLLQPTREPFVMPTDLPKSSGATGTTGQSGEAGQSGALQPAASAIPSAPPGPAAEVHGADTWRSAGMNGAAVKIGILDRRQ